MGSTNVGHKTNERKLTAIERQKHALELRKAGVPYSVIAERVGYKQASGAHAAVMSAMKATIKEPANEVRKLELERLDALLLAVWAKATSGDTKAVMTALRVMERRSAFLGLDAPIKRSDTITINREAIATEVAQELGMPVDEVLSLIPVAEKAVAIPEEAD